MKLPIHVNLAIRHIYRRCTYLGHTTTRQYPNSFNHLLTIKSHKLLTNTITNTQLYQLPIVVFGQLSNITTQFHNNSLSYYHLKTITIIIPFKTCIYNYTFHQPNTTQWSNPQSQNINSIATNNTLSSISPQTLKPPISNTKNPN